MDEQLAKQSHEDQQNNQPKHEHRRTRPLQIVFGALLVAVIGFGGGWLGANTKETDQTAIERVVLDEQSNLISTIAKEVGKSVVSVNVTSEATVGNSFFGGGRRVEQQSAGTGIILSKEGLIMTNRHVVPTGTTSVSVTLSDGTTLDNVKVIGRTNNSDPLDVAFLQITDRKDHELTPAKIGASSKTRVGDSVVAIGNALGQFQNTVTTGILSGYGRSVEASDESGNGSESLDNLFQTDAAINQGNSGGPLVNLRGEVIGMNTAVAGDAENIGFAIPIDNVKGLIASVSKKGTLERPYLGVLYVPLTDAIAKRYDLSVNRGAYIPKASEYGQETLYADGPGAKSGLKEGDVIVKVDGTSVNEQTSLASLLGKHQPGDTVKLSVSRDGKTQDISVKLGTMPTSATN
jgi:serine protease Do